MWRSTSDENINGFLVSDLRKSQQYLHKFEKWLKFTLQATVRPTIQCSTRDNNMTTENRMTDPSRMMLRMGHRNKAIVALCCK